jgi:hypothetical protein
VTELRPASIDDVSLVVSIMARAYGEDPVWRWVFPDAATRPAQLHVLFNGFVGSFFPDAGTVHLLEDACTSLWRSPSFQYPRLDEARSAAAAASGFTPDVLGTAEIARVLASAPGTGWPSAR